MAARVEEIMGVTDIVVLVAAVLTIAGLGWFFFGPRRSRSAELTGGVQRLEVTVKGGYRPDVIRVREGVPVELVFDRQESGECTSQVIFPELRVSAVLPAYAKTTVRLEPVHAGSYGFACGMNMIRGSLLVDPAEPSGPGATLPAAPMTPAEEPIERAGAPSLGEQSAAEAEATQAAERRAEIEDLSRRVLVGAVLTAPVLFAVMATSLFTAMWVPGFLLNHAVQLVLITPVMFYTGWPIHRIGWLTLVHRSADMNSLITLGTVAAYTYSLIVTLAPGLLPPEVRE
ncbi:MAG: cupredoxin domain-containing protein, partial [Actinomadura sp.]